MQAKRRAMWATVKMLRIFICYKYIRMRTRSMEQDEYDRNIKFLQQLHKLSWGMFFESVNEKNNKINETRWIRSQY